MKTLSIFLSLFFSFVYSFGQLSGTYTIGGTNPDYLTIRKAVNALSLSGVSGPVTFNIRSGIYQESIWIWNINSNYLVTFQSEALDSSAVIIEADSNFLPFALQISSSSGFKINKLTFSGTCHISRSPKIQFINNVVHYNNGVSSLSNSYSDSCIITNNTILGEFNNAFSNNSSITNNTILGKFSNAYSKNCSITNNTILGGFSNAYSKNCSITNNTIRGRSFDSSFSSNCIITNNRIFTSFSKGSSYDTIANNFIGGQFYNTGFYVVISFNNFSLNPQNYFDNRGAYCVITNNNMPATYWDKYGLSTLSNNNYPFGRGAEYDSHPFIIDPQYNDTSLYATNPQLVGKGNYLPAFPYDIDMLLRKNPPTIGANEICILKDTLNSFCGDSLTLSICSLPDTGNFIWRPSAGLNNIHLAQPTLFTSVSGWYVVNDTASGFSDSLYINVLPFQVNAGADDSILYCGYSDMVLHASYNAGATYQWYPADSLTAPNSIFTHAKPSRTTTYVVEATINGCSQTYDSVTIYVNPLPISYAYLASQNFNSICFLNASTCADNYLWLFGDSMSSTDINPCHIYPDTGRYLVSVISCNSFGCDTFQGYIFVDSVVIIIDPCAGVNCDDSDACTTDTCIGGNCQHSAISCDDGDACNGTETCVPASGCQAGIPLLCNDNDICTSDTCTGGACHYNPLDCDDGNAATADSCDAGTCIHTTITAIGADNSESITVYPNPTDGWFIISGSTGIHSAEVINLLGEIIYSTGVILPQPFIEMNLSKSAKGIYFVRLQTGSGMHICKVVI